MEYVDLVDEHDRVMCPSVSMEEAYRQKEWFLRGVNLLIQNSQGEFWIPRRSAQKKLFPNGLDFSAGGHVSAGETYLQAIQREASEEIGLLLDAKRLRLIHQMKIVPEDLGIDIKFLAHTFLYLYGGKINHNPEDISEAEWLHPKELLKKLLDPSEPKAKSGLPVVIRTLTSL